MEKGGWMLVKRHAFGARSGPHNALCWVDEGTLMYPVGKTVTLHQLSTNNQNFLDTSYCNTLGITSLAISDNKKFVAIAEGGENPQVQIIDTMTRKRRKLLSISPNEFGSDRFTAMAFSVDGRHLVTQAGGPSWNLYYWNWERSKPLAMIPISDAMNTLRTNQKQKEREGIGSGGGSQLRVTKPSASFQHASLVTHVSICPSDTVTIVVSGVNFIRFYRYTDGLLQPQPSCEVPSESQKTFVTHCWVDKERLVASTHHGELVLIERGRYIEDIYVPNAPIPSVAASSYGRGNAQLPVVTAICPTHSGFVTGNDHGMLCVYHSCNEVSTEGEGLIAFSYSSSSSYSFHSMVCVPLREPAEPDTTAASDRRANLGFSKSDPLSETSRRMQYKSRSDDVSNGSTGANLPVESLDGNPGSNGRATRESEELLPTAQFRLTTECSTGVLPSIIMSSGRCRAQYLGTYSSLGDERKGNAPHHTESSEKYETGVNMAATTTASDASAGPVQPFLATLSGFGGPGVGDTATHSVLFERCCVAALALNQSETRLCVLTRSGRVYGTDFRMDWSKLSVQQRTETLSTNPTPDLNHATPDFSGHGSIDASTPLALFEAVCQPFHTGAINGMDCCARKPFLITSSSDHSVRLWNIITSRLEMVQYYAQEPGAVAIHPSGLMAVVCFPDKVRVMSVLWNAFHERKVISFRYATDVLFSRGGQYFAVAHSNLVDIFVSTTCEPCGQLRGHPQRIKDMKWSAISSYPTDSRLITCSMDGMMIDWNMFEMRKEIEHSDKRFRYAAVDADDKSVWAVATPASSAALGVQWKATLREIERSSMTSVASVSMSGASNHYNATAEDFEFMDMALTVLRVSPHKRMLFGGGEDGSLKVMPFPLQTGVTDPPLAAHSSRITRMALTFDETTLFTASEDGSVLVWDIREEGAAAGRAVTFEATSFMSGVADEVLVTQQYMEDTKLEIESLQQRIERLKTELCSEERRHTHEQGTSTRERIEEYKNEASTLAIEYASLCNRKSEQERTFASIRAEKVSEAAQNLESLVRSRQMEVQELETLCSELQRTLEAEKEEHAARLRDAEEAVVRERREEQERYAEIFSQKREVLEKLESDFEHNHQNNTEALHQLELDVDTEFQTVNERHSHELSALRERFLRMKGEGAIMRKNAALIAKEVDVRANEASLLDAAKVSLVEQLNNLHHSVNQLHQDIDERDTVIGEKEKHIYALKKENQELEKYRFVLDHRIRQLKAQMVPKQHEMLQCNQRIKLRNRELQELHECNRTLQGNIDELKSDIAEQQQHIKQMHNRIKDFETYKMRFQRDIGDVVPALQDVQQLQDTIENIYQAHVVARIGERIASVDPSIRTEFQNHLEYLSTSVNALQHKLKLEEDRHKKEVSAMMVENMSLIREIHSLRGEIHHLRALMAAETAAKRARGGLKTGGRFAQRRKVPTATAAPTPPKRGERGFPGEEKAPLSISPPSLHAGGLSRSSSASATEKKKAGAALPAAEEALPISETNDAMRKDSSERASLHLRASLPPPELERTTMELRMLQSYINAMERALGGTASSLVGGVAPTSASP